MRRLVLFAVLNTLLIGTGAMPIASQTQPAFEVISIKPNKTEQGPGSIGVFGGRFIATAVTVRPILQFAYRPVGSQLLAYQLVGLPAWIDEDRFDFDAKPEGDSRRIPRQQIQEMVQSLLKDRFQLKAHQEMRELPVYNLIVRRNRLRLSDDQSPPPPTEVPESGSLPRGSYRSVSSLSGVTISANAIPISTFVFVLQNRIDRRIVDKTNLKSLYDIELRFKSELLTGQPDAVPSDSNTPSLFTAIEEQLGLRLESARGQVQVVVIDSISKPSEN
jgi:uncharacterized protein (TIGR03435 family)